MSAASEAPLLEAKSCSIVVGGLKALTDFNLQVRKKDLLGLIGPNGAGKTTAFNVLTGVYKPTSGKVYLSGTRVNGRPVYKINRLGAARTFQNIRLFKELSAIDNVKVACLAETSPIFSSGIISNIEAAATEREDRHEEWLAQLSPAMKVVDRVLRHIPFSGFSRDFYGPVFYRRAIAGGFDAFNNYYDWWRALAKTPGFLREEQQITQRAEHLLEVMGLSHRRDEEARNLPYGEQRRLEIARALGTNPKVLLLDEPAAGMNTGEKAELMVLIRKLRDQFDLGILVIEHDMKLVMGICEKIIVLDHGETISVGTGAEVRADRKVIEAYLGDSYLESHGTGAAR
ncbi:MAG: ABC transporter ATP-binding protein [Myxococcaceae bacterium]